jgi:CheY-like chemotaxis protein
MRPPSRRIALPGTCVLLVDDDEDFLELFSALLSTRGADVFCVTSVAEALLSVRERSFHVIVSDLEMPGPDGLALIKELRASAETRISAIPAIALTARSDQMAREHALAAGFCRHLVKPVDVAILCAEIALLIHCDATN